MTTSQGPLLVPTLIATLLATASLARVAHAQPSPPVPPPPASGLAVPPASEVPLAPGETAVDWEAVLHGQGRMLDANSAARQAVATAPAVERAQATVRLAGAGVDRVAYNFIPQANVTLRYTRLSPIVNGQLFMGPTLTPAMIEALVSGVDDPDARFLWQQTLTQQAQLANYRFPVILDNFVLHASASYALSDLLLTVWPAFESAEASVDAARHGVDNQREQVAYNAREAFYNYARARGALAVAMSALEQAQVRFRQVQAFVAAGSAARVDEMRLRAQVATAEVAIARANGSVRLTATTLRTLLHLPPETELGVGEDVLGPPPPLPGRPEDLLQQALDRREDVQALRSTIRAYERQVDAAEGSRWPHLAVQFNFDEANPNQRIFPQTAQFRETWDFSAIVTWSPHDVLNGEANAASARAQRDQTEADLRALEDGIRVQVAEALSSYVASREAYDAARVGLDAARESYRVQMERYRAGAATLTDLTDANADLIRAQLELLNAAIDARLAIARLARAIGTGAPERQ